MISLIMAFSSYKILNSPRSPFHIILHSRVVPLMLGLWKHLAGLHQWGCLWARRHYSSNVRGPCLGRFGRCSCFKISALRVHRLRAAVSLLLQLSGSLDAVRSGTATVAPLESGVKLCEEEIDHGVDSFDILGKPRGRLLWTYYMQFMGDVTGSVFPLAAVKREA